MSHCDEEAQTDHADSVANVQKHYRADIDGLRAIAVLAVVIYHINTTWLPGGFFGVDIFFVISGYVVSGSLARHRFEFTGDFLADFYARRCRRLFPSFFLVCFTTGFAVALLSPWFDTEIDKMLHLGVASTFGTANNWLWFVQDAYFDQRPGLDEANAFLHLWSLGVEEQFYCLFPVMFLAGLGQQVVYTAFWKPRKLGFGLAIMVLSVTSLGTALTLESQGLNISTFYLMPLRFWQLGAGVLSWQLCAGPVGTHIQSVLERSRIFSGAMGILGGLLLVCSFIIPGPNPAQSSTRVLHSMLPVSAAVVYIMSGLSSWNILNASLSHSLPVLLGRLSYSIYLWHVPVLAIFRRRFGDTPYIQYLAPVCLVVTLLLSCTSFYLFEEPARNAELASNNEVFTVVVVAGSANASLFWLMIWLRTYYGISSGIWLIALGAKLICWLVLMSCLPRPSRWRDRRVPSIRLFAAILAGVMVLHIGSIAVDSSYAEYHPLFFGDRGENSTLPQQSPKALLSTSCNNVTTVDKRLFSYDLNEGLADNCECAFVEKTTPFVPEHAVCGAKVANLTACYEDRPIDQTTFAVQYESLAECFIGGGWTGREAEARKCLTRKEKGKSAIFLLGDSHARALQNGIAAAIPREILPAMWYGTDGDRLEQLWPALEGEVMDGDMVWYVVEMQDDHRKDTYQSQLSKLHELTGKKNATLMLVEDWPHLQNPGPGGAGRQEAFFCHSHHIVGKPTPCAVRSSEMEERRASIISILQEMQTKEGVHVFNTTTFLCPAGVCDYNIPNRHASAYFDAGHLNPFGSRYLAPFICGFVKSHGLK